MSHAYTKILRISVSLAFAIYQSENLTVSLQAVNGHFSDCCMAHRFSWFAVCIIASVVVMTVEFIS